jgi:hypothetical protein
MGSCTSHKHAKDTGHVRNEQYRAIKPCNAIALAHLDKDAQMKNRSHQM